MKFQHLLILAFYLISNTLFANADEIIMKCEKGQGKYSGWYKYFKEKDKNATIQYLKTNKETGDSEWVTPGCLHKDWMKKPEDGKRAHKCIKGEIGRGTYSYELESYTYPKLTGISSVTMDFQKLERLRKTFHPDGKLESEKTSSCKTRTLPDESSDEFELTWKDGRKYIGPLYKNKNIPHGHGTMTWDDGRKYVGEHKEGKRNGKGIFTWPDGDKYVGEWKDDWRTGNGTYTWASGGKYVGGFKKNKHHGYGTYTKADGSIEEGIWDNDTSPKLVNARYNKKFTPLAVCIGSHKESQIKTLMNLYLGTNYSATANYMLSVGCNNDWTTPISGRLLEEFSRNSKYVGIKTREYMDGLGWLYGFVKIDEWDSY